MHLAGSLYQYLLYFAPIGEQQSTIYLLPATTLQLLLFQKIRA
ncbi:hypothetical protein PPEP_a3583 [Pseudoalteromonas peptidolytica F12-50-A1]|uniref:Uncharacterized protein n=1 Tax=Pseudoalteromonas peptidolytica F12-50-A1 TaxID=1315280 RepID=A0A8I0MVX8_9GAMM|nr:hypothetical protein [Pseudoalteromonas peptidolytica F12-50-A1]